MTPFVVLGYAVKSTLALALAGLACAALRRRSAALRHLVWLAALSGLLLLPLAPRLGLAWRGPAAAQAVVEAPARTVLTVTAEGETNGRPWRQVLAGLWAAGFFLVGGRFLRAHALAQRLVRQARPWRAGIRLSRATVMPMVCRLRDPVIVLPEEAEGWSAERLRAVLAHERMHVARRDTVALAVGQLVCSLYWPQPLVWLAARALRKESEQACDDGVLDGGMQPSVYAEHLVEIASRLPARQPAQAGGIAMARISDLERRVKALLEPARDRSAVSAGGAVVTTFLAAALLLPLAALNSTAWAQTGRLSGVVRDASGAVVPKARVLLTNHTGPVTLKEVAQTNEAGEFSFETLADGEYDLAILKPGFARLEQKGLSFRSGQTGPLQFTLNIGKISETLTVSAPRPATLPPPPAGDIPKRITVGGIVQQSNRLTAVPPVYPPECKQAGIEGTVFLRAIIGRDGSILNVEQINRMVDARLVDAAVQAVRQWRYKPTLLNGEPVEVATEIEINFTLTR